MEKTNREKWLEAFSSLTDEQLAYAISILDCYCADYMIEKLVSVRPYYCGLEIDGNGECPDDIAESCEACILKWLRENKPRELIYEPVEVSHEKA